MKTRITIAAVGIVVCLAGVPGFAQTYEDLPDTPPDAFDHPEINWTGHLNYVLGYKRLASAWQPARDQVEFGLVDFDFRHVSWPVSLAGQFLLSYSDNIPDQPGFIGNQSGTFEFNLGARKVWDADQALQPFIGGGLTVAGGSTSTFIDFGWGEGGTVQEESDTNVGYWVGGGCYWLLNRALHLGVNLQYSSARIDLFNKGLDAGGYHALFMIGYHW